MLPTNGAVIAAMVDYNRGDAPRINHALKVYAYAKSIGEQEGLLEKEQAILETAAILHDIGIHESERKYGSADGRYQQIEGPDIAETLLHGLGCKDKDAIDRIRFLIAHHHTYTDVDGLDYRILNEADFLVNLDESPSMRRSSEEILRNHFQTGAGVRFWKALFQL